MDEIGDLEETAAESTREEAWSEETMESIQKMWRVRGVEVPRTDQVKKMRKKEG